MSLRVRLHSVGYSLPVFIFVLVAGVGCQRETQRETLVTGQLLLADSSPLANHSMVFWPVCGVPRWHRQSDGGGWTGGYWYGLVQDRANPEAKTDEQGRFSLRVNAGWADSVCATHPGCTTHPQDVQSSNADCKRAGFTLGLANVGGRQLERVSLQFLAGEEVYFYPMDSLTVDFGVVKLRAGWLLAHMDLPPGVTKDDIFTWFRVFERACTRCHGRNGTGGPDTTSAGRPNRIAGPDLGDHEWIHGDGSYESILNLLKQADRQGIRFCKDTTVNGQLFARNVLDFVSLFVHSWLRNRDDHNIVESELAGMAAYIYALRHSPRADISVQNDDP
jgi:hypothetical protein